MSRPGNRSVDDTGKKFGMLTAIRDVGSENNQRVWRYVCECGNEVDRVRSRVARVAKSGTPNCGCANSEIRARNGRANKTHGWSQHGLYGVWRHMISRCTSPDSKDWPLYGGRGISVCKEWMDLDTFCRWGLSSGYMAGLTIERIDVDDGYHPENCTWIPNEDQAKNTRRLRMLSFGGEVKYASEWARDLGISVRTIISRSNRGLSDHDVLAPYIDGGRR